MFRNILTGVILTAMLSLMLSNTDAEARHCRRQCQNSCCGQNSNWGQSTNYGYNQNGYSQGCNSCNGGYGYSNGGYSHGGYSHAGYGGYGHRGYSSVGIGYGSGGYGNRSYGGLGFYSGY